MKGLKELKFGSRYDELFEEAFLDQNQDLKEKNRSELFDLYGGEEIAEYNDIQDFDLCKKQLLILLNRVFEITQIGLFKRVEKKVQNLEKNSNINPNTNLNSIQIYLNRIKKSLEDHFIYIQKNHHKVDKVKLNSFIVHLCDIGAESNLMMALTYFRLNSVELLVMQSKRDFIYDAAVRFIRDNNLLRENQVGEHLGDEIHYANGLLNGVADKEKIPKQIDLYIPQSNYFQKYIESFSYYLDELKTIPNFLTIFNSNLPAPINEVLNSRLNPEKFNKGYTDLKDYMEFWGYFDFPEKEYKKIYDVFVLEDELEIRPKTDFEKFYSIAVALWLEERQIITGVTQEVGDLKILDDGHSILTIEIRGEEESEEVLRHVTIDEVVFLYFHPDLSSNVEFKKRLMDQLKIEDLLLLYTKNESQADLSKINLMKIKSSCLEAIFKKTSLPESALLKLESCLKNEDKIEFCKYVLSHDCPFLKSNFKYYASRLELKDRVNLFKNALKNNLYLVVQELLTPKFLNVLEDAKIYPLYLAASSGSVETIRLLVSSGFEVDDPDNWGKKEIPPIYAALKSGFYQASFALAQFAREVKNDVSYIGQFFNFFCNYKKNSLQYVDRQWNNALMLAARKGYVEIVRLLLQKKVDPNLRNYDGETALFQAIKYNQDPIVDLFMTYPNINVNLKNYQNQTPLIYVLEQENLEMLKILLKSEFIDLNLPKRNKETPLFIALRKGNIDLVRDLLQSGVNFNLGVHSCPEFFKSLTETHSIEVRNRMSEWVKIQSKKGPRVTMKPIDFARILGEKNIISLLTKYVDTATELEKESIENTSCCFF